VCPGMGLLTWGPFAVQTLPRACSRPTLRPAASLGRTPSCYGQPCDEAQGGRGHGRRPAPLGQLPRPRHHLLLHADRLGPPPPAPDAGQPLQPRRGPEGERNLAPHDGPAPAPAPALLLPAFARHGRRVRALPVPPRAPARAPIPPRTLAVDRDPPPARVGVMCDAMGDGDDDVDKCMLGVSCGAHPSVDKPLTPLSLRVVCGMVRGGAMAMAPAFQAPPSFYNSPPHCMPTRPLARYGAPTLHPFSGMGAYGGDDGIGVGVRDDDDLNEAQPCSAMSPRPSHPSTAKPGLSPGYAAGPPSPSPSRRSSLSEPPLPDIGGTASLTGDLVLHTVLRLCMASGWRLG
jgi:hypothetical protein